MPGAPLCSRDNAEFGEKRTFRSGLTVLYVETIRDFANRFVLSPLVGGSG